MQSTKNSKGDSKTQRYREAEEAYGKAVEIRTHLAAWPPEVYEPDLANSLWNLAALCEKLKNKEKLLTVLRSAQPLFEKLAQKHPDRYGKKTEIIRKVLAEA